jgi:hypothetical protein
VNSGRRLQELRMEKDGAAVLEIGEYDELRMEEEVQERNKRAGLARNSVGRRHGKKRERDSAILVYPTPSNTNHICRKRTRLHSQCSDWVQPPTYMIYCLFGTLSGC